MLARLINDCLWFNDLETGMDSRRIADLLKLFLTLELSQQQLKDISTYIDILLRWNAKLNLTAIRDRDQIVTRHFGESLFTAQHLFPRNSARDEAIGDGELTSAVRVIDVGSGAGFPGLPIKIWNPSIQMKLIEANHKKATFLREVIRTLGLRDAWAVASRAETLSEVAEIVTLRAVERFEIALPMATRLVAPEGRLALLVGRNQLDGIKGGDFSWQNPLPIPLSAQRVLLIGTRHGAT